MTLVSAANRRLRAFSVLLLLATMPVLEVRAQEVDPLAAVLIVDAQSVIRESQAVLSLRTGIEVRRQALQQELLTRQEALRTEEESLINRRDQMSPEAFAEERRRFQQRVATLQRDAQIRSSSLDRLYASGFTQVEKELQAVVEEIVDERGARLVLNRTAVISFDTSLDITAEALQRLNSRLPTVTLPDNADQAPAGNNAEDQEQSSGG